jgi:hypothetical protein
VAKHKIPKNRSLNEMFAGVKEELTFETGGVEDEPQAGLTNLPQGRQHNSLRKEFFTKELQEQVGALLLDIKLAYYKDGVGEVSLKVVRDGNNVVIKTTPKKV